MNTQAATNDSAGASRSSARPAHADAGAGAEVDPKKYTFNMTPAAARKLYDNLKKRGTPDSALRVGVRGGGCSGYSYVLEFADKPPRSRDLVFTYPVERKPEDEIEPGTVSVICDKKSILFLNESTLDWEKTLMYQGYRFVNPSEKSSCGCNESFAI